MGERIKRISHQNYNRYERYWMGERIKRISCKEYEEYWTGERIKRISHQSINDEYIWNAKM